VSRGQVWASIIVMAVYLVTWDLNKESDYKNTSKELHAHLDRLETIKHPGLDSVRFVSTSKSAKELIEYLGPVLDADDKIVATQMKDSYWGWVSKTVWEWIAARI
jgi:hypothetical protein